MYVYTIEDFGSSGFTEITSITIHTTLRAKDTKKSRSRRHENKLAPLPPTSLEGAGIGVKETADTC